MRRLPLDYVRSRNDRANVATTAILQIIADAEDGPALPQGELHCRIWRYLADQFDAVEEVATYQGGAGDDE